MNISKTLIAISIASISSLAVAETDQITLSTGWNLISFSGTPVSQDIGAIMTGDGLVEMQSQTESYKSARASRATLKRVDSHSAYYINSSSESDVTISVETSPTSTAYGMLSTGWNMFAVGESMTPAELVENLNNAGNTVVEIQSAVGSYKVARANRATLREVAPKTGYWVNVSSVSVATGMQDASAVASSEAQVSSMTAPDGKTLRVLVPSIKTSIGTDAVTAGETTYNIPALPVAVYANSAEDNDTSVIVDSAYAGEKVVMQLTDTTSGAVTYTSIAALDSAGGVNASGTTDDSGQAGTFE
jgi:hypothetical protein